MKGKGKPSECPLQFPVLDTVSMGEDCPCYSAILLREDKSVKLEDLDILQPEIEAMLTAVVKRLRNSESELQLLSSAPLAVTPKGKVAIPEKGQKRSASKSEEKPNKRFKETPVKYTPFRSKGKGAREREYALPESPRPMPPAMPEPPKPGAKTDMSNRFWALVEPYCADITEADIQVVEELIATSKDDAEYHKIPQLGNHFLDYWTSEDINEEASEEVTEPEVAPRRRKYRRRRRQYPWMTVAKRRPVGNKICDNRKSNGTITSQKDREELLARAEKDGTSPFGPLTQRLVQALIEENIVTNLEDDDVDDTDSEHVASFSPGKLAEKLKITNSVKLEKRIKNELMEQGILEPSDMSGDENNTDDEVCQELRRKQEELRVLSQSNQERLENLITLARAEMKKQELRKALTAADAEVLEAYRKVQNLRNKKKVLTKKEKDAALKAIRDREELVNKLEDQMT